MLDSVVSEVPFIIVYCLDKCKTQRMCDEAVDNCLAALKFIPDFLLQVKCLKILIKLCWLMMIYSFFNEDFDKVTFIANQRYIVVDLEKINLDNDNNFDEDDTDTIIHVRLLVWRSKFEKREKKGN